MSDLDLGKVIARRDQVLEAVTSAAESDPRVSTAFLVGSLATGTADAYSDIDVVLIADPAHVDALLADRLTFPTQFGEVLLQFDSSWNVWCGASQVLTLLDSDLPLWIDMDIWSPSVPGIPREARVLAGTTDPVLDMSLSDLSTMLQELHGSGQVAKENLEGVEDVARMVWGLKGIARGYATWPDGLQKALEGPWPTELERAREPIRRYADHVREVVSIA